MASWIPYAVMTGAMVVVGAVGGLATDVGPWYRQLNKPSWNPPDWLFGPAWTLIYICIIVAVGRAWNAAAAADKNLLLVALVVNLVLNVLWSVFFFTLRRPDWALIEAIVLWLSIVALLICLYRIVPSSGLLMLPYLVWVTFAAWLTLTIVRLNPAAHLS